MNKKDLPVLEKAINDCRKVIKEYKRSPEQNSLLVERLKNVEHVLLDDFFKVSTSDTPTKKVQKKVGKPEPSKLGGTKNQKEGGEKHGISDQR